MVTGARGRHVRARGARGWLGLAMCSALVACFNPSYDQPRCSPLGECPSGYACVSELCVRAGAPMGDAGADAPILDAPQSQILSCKDLAATCGPASNDDCCNSLEVPGGTYYRSYDTAGDASSGSQGLPATVSSFRLDKYEVTVGRFRAFVMAGKGTQADPPASGAGAHGTIPGSGWDPTWTASLVANSAALIAAMKCDTTTGTWTDAPGGNEQRPMNCVSWYEAMAFCVWDGGYLPTEAEWNYAAAGGNQQRAYPWSTPPSELTIDGAHASYSDGTSCVGDGLPGCTLTDLVPVGSKPAGDGRWGHADLAGNVFEWMLDANYVSPCLDCGTPSPGRIRGGTYSFPTTSLRSSYRAGTAATSHASIFGLRCARPL